ncbi:MAG: hypothetical protein ABUS57_01645 [Pseudomonadota bacterium]
MRVLLAALALFSLSACQAAPHDFPASAKAEFNRGCPSSDSVCECTWDELTRAMTYEDYQAAVDRFRREGLMDPRITRARTHCIERKHA